MKKYLIIGNAENTHIVKWAKALVKHFDLYVISSKTTHSEIVALLPSGHIHNLKLEVSGDGGNYQLIFKYWKIKKMIRQIEPDYVNAHYITSHGFLAALIRKFSKLRFYLVQSAWGSDILVTPFRNKLFRHITKFSLNKADLITSDSTYMSQVIKSISKTRTMTFSFGLECLPEFVPNEKEEFLFFSNRMLSENYRIDEIIRFFSRIVLEHDQARLIISHDGDKRTQLETMVLDLGLQEKIKFAGFVSEQVQNSYYKKAQFYISIPESDATSVSLLEAMAYGCIPVVSDIPANHEWIREHENGIFYKDGITGIHDIKGALKNKTEIVQKNREIIQQRAIFPDAIQEYVNQISKL